MNNMNNINNINNTNDFVIISEISKKYDTVLTDFNSIIVVVEVFKKFSHIKLICKHSSEYRDIRKAEEITYKISVTSETLPERERKYEKNIQKHDCPCFMYANTTKKGKLTVRSRETQHNHVIKENCRAYAMHRKLLLKTMALVVKHLENNDNISTIFHSLKINGFTNIVQHDIANIKQYFRKSDEGREIFEFLTTLQDLDFYVRYSVSNTEDNQINMIFFVHQDAIKEAQKMSETVIIDVTYKKNSH
ncbi:hypothetical protein PHYBLDRAFT_58389 [Phycomyces blakesleeanus NRRL 1555(-)]|uniref:FAR1 domain-containing protein n=1 Tax=Phycomyces blakesleeanus (strain ATCC 8743b / DSM 1359 / FGSC 10004 / NBRC 33097 / NRRL 1555) TaxID=763407 RepID=A0A163ELM7_PHYB8|nr:hypothetical protein PHYBLDRAFT_58389 [Phycomyces blakesleeanus NRRL 1555(-)]OAD79340.1 hypothetical protein PHYBLDRAFT_58389 [Phycomyces blakesleeanus NRRL 1555(-)]|eukprot:XP_018297380.1 hypothetical protein PHYBLDRAFT_58389 [Phycomyces blakesleeanus NRRL 1555(-)]